MKKVVLFLGLVGLFAGLAQAQTPQVRLLWERTLSGYNFHSPTLVESDTSNVQFVTWLDQQYTISKTGTVDSVRYEFPYPERREIEGVWFPAWWKMSKDGRFKVCNVYLSSGEAGGPLHCFVYGQDGQLVFKKRGEEIVAFSGDGSLFAGAKQELEKMSANPPWWDTKPYGDTIFLYNRTGGLINKAFVRRIGELTILPYTKRIVSFSQEPKSNRMEWRLHGELVVFDSLGRRLWGTTQASLREFAVSDSGRIFGIDRRSGGLWGSFYNPEGQKEGEVKLDYAVPRDYGRSITMFPDGRRALVHSGATLGLIAANPVRIVWKSRSQPGGGWGGVTVDPSGQRIWATYRASQQDTLMKLCLLDLQGQMLWQGELPSRPYAQILAGRRYVAVLGGISGTRVTMLYEVR